MDRKSNIQTIIRNANHNFNQKFCSFLESKYITLINWWVSRLDAPTNYSRFWVLRKYIILTIPNVLNKPNSQMVDTLTMCCGCLIPFGFLVLEKSKQNDIYLSVEKNYVYWQQSS